MSILFAAIGVGRFYARADGPDRVTASNSVQVGESTYLVETDRRTPRKLELVWSNEGAAESRTERVVIDGSTIPASHPLKELNLAPWSGGNLICVAIAQAKDGDEAYVMLLPFPITPIESPATRFKKVYYAPFRLTTLAVNGNFQGDGIVVVFGKLARRPENGQRIVQAGAIFLDDCPIPPVANGAVSEFSTTQQR
jgi:hypothetical protein